MIGARLTSDLASGRAEAESRMSETVVIGRFELQRSPGSLEQELVLLETYYEGKARVKYPTASSFSKTPVAQQLVETKIVLSIPSGSPVLPVAALIRVVESISDASLVGRFYRVDGPAQAGQTTAHRYPVVEES